MKKVTVNWCFSSTRGRKRGVAIKKVMRKFEVLLILSNRGVLQLDVLIRDFQGGKVVDSWGKHKRKVCSRRLKSAGYEELNLSNGTM